MDWQPIEAAPSDTAVLLGKYIDHGDAGLVWVQGVGVPVITITRWFFFKRRVLEWEGRKYSHWKPLPPPPKTQLGA